jgi:hypothetical protein
LIWGTILQNGIENRPFRGFFYAPGAIEQQAFRWNCCQNSDGFKVKNPKNISENHVFCYSDNCYFYKTLTNLFMEPTENLFREWNQYMTYGVFATIAMGALIFLFYEFKVLQIRDYKEKYDYVNLHEIRFFWYAMISFLLAGAFAINTIAHTAILQNGTRWFFVRVFISLCFVVIGYFVFHSLIRIYYPKKLSRRLIRYRTATRVSPDGNPMRRLSEEEEDTHMERSMIEEEEIQVVDYDVWIDDKTGFKKIEKYIVHDQTAECPECGFYTLSISSEEIGKAPTQTESGLIVEHLECSYCGHKEKREVVVSNLASNIV